MSYTPEIKKGLINILMFSLYSDERTIYREYVQNALDAINKAVAMGVLNATKDGLVRIDIDKSKQEITIRDNGCGIKAEDAARVLLDISSSEKNGIDQAGQFGIGRLVGGGYCHQLVFKTSAKGEDKATHIIFDVDRIWKMVKYDTEDYLATTVIKECTKIVYEKEEENEHYFEVVLKNVKEDSAPALLNIEGIINYLSIIAPIEYKPTFETLIADSCKELPEFKTLHEDLEKVQLFVNDKRIQKQYGLSIVGTKDDIDRLEYFKLEDTKYGMLGWGWFALTKFSIQIPTEDELACIRLRKHNIQIGSSDLLSGRTYWREDRSNSYFYGEFFVTHPNIMPNAARDGLASTPETAVLNEKLREYFMALKSLYTKANEAKKSIDKIKEGIERIKKFGINDYNAKDLIDNKGIAKFDKLVKNASFLPMVRMLNLYKPAYETAIDQVNQVRKNNVQEINPIENSSVNNVGDEKNITEISKIPTNPVQGTELESKIANPITVLLEESDEGKINIEPTIVRTTPTRVDINQAPIRSKDVLDPLKGILDESELWIIRRVFSVLNRFCPKTEHDRNLVAELEKLIVKEFENK